MNEQKKLPVSYAHPQKLRNCNCTYRPVFHSNIVQNLLRTDIAKTLRDNSGRYITPVWKSFNADLKNITPISAHKKRVPVQNYPYQINPKLLTGIRLTTYYLGLI